MEIYVFGSIVRGDIDEFSDIDLLILKDFRENIPNINKEDFSIYTYQRISQLWQEGNPFSWHLYFESKCIYCRDNTPYLYSLGKPKKYLNLIKDLSKFQQLFIDSKLSIETAPYSIDFDLSMIFLAIRNFASCFSLGYLNKNEFSRDSALKIGQHSLKIDYSIYSKLRNSRILSSRGIGNRISNKELIEITSEFNIIESWFVELLKLVK